MQSAFLLPLSYETNYWYTVPMEKNTNLDSIVNSADKYLLVEWSEKYSVGIDMINRQHRELVNQTNQLYKACLARDKELDNVFREAMSSMVEYVRFHFTAELELLQRIKYPKYQEHKKEHDGLIMKILGAAKDFNEGNKFIPNNFVRTLKDWVFSHIAVYDQLYAAYVNEQKRKGLLTDEMLIGREFITRQRIDFM